MGARNAKSNKLEPQSIVNHATTRVIFRTFQWEKKLVLHSVQVMATMTEYVLVAQMATALDYVSVWRVGNEELQ